MIPDDSVNFFFIMLLPYLTILWNDQAYFGRYPGVTKSGVYQILSNLTRSFVKNGGKTFYTSTLNTSLTDANCFDPRCRTLFA